jgi:hypothetical protein
VKLLVPYVGELQAVDARLMRLAEFLGISCEPLLLTKPVGQCAEYLERAAPNQQMCFVVNPRVMQDWVGGDSLPPEMASFLVSRFPHLLVHAPRPVPFDGSVIAALSCGHLNAIQGLEHSSQSYEISPDSKDVCEAFAGLSFGLANSANDRVFSTGPGVSAVRRLISLGGRPFMAALRREKTEILFLAGQDVADLNAEVGDTPLVEYFSRLLPHAMALRYTFGEESWRPCEQHASVIIDDPLLRRNYGFLNFESLLGLMNQHNFHTTVAFIPHNFRRSSPRITRMFRENAGRFALCFHGNDHTGAEFASTDTVLLNTMLQIAELRMNLHYKMTGLNCDRVMVFPQGNFSVEAMSVLKSRNFDSAVNTVPHPTQQPVRLTLGEIAQPAVLRYGGFPLFLRKSSLHTQSADIAFNLFFGKPVLIVEHHDVFQHPESLIEAASRINAAAPEIHWSNLASAVAASTLIRRAPGAYNVRAYSRTVRVSNDSGSTQRFLIKWGQCGQGASVEQVLKDGTPCVNFEADDAGTRLSVDLAPGSSQTFSVVYRNVHATLRSLGFRRNARAYLRRRLSEVRDNYLSKNLPMLAAAKTLQERRFLH